MIECPICKERFDAFESRCPKCGCPKLTATDPQTEEIYRAAIQGDLSAANRLGKLYFEGKNMPQNYVSALFWFQKAARGGNPSGLYNLGVCFAKGYGTEKDAASARLCFEKAAKAGKRNAQAALQTLEREFDTRPEVNIYTGNDAISELFRSWDEEKLYREKMYRERNNAGQGGKSPSAEKPSPALQKISAEEKKPSHAPQKVFAEKKKPLEKHAVDDGKPKTENRSAISEALKASRRLPKAFFADQDESSENQREQERLNTVLIEVERQHSELQVEYNAEIGESRKAWENRREAFIEARENGFDPYSVYSEVMQTEEWKDTIEQMKKRVEQEMNDLDVLKRKPYFARLDFGSSKYDLHTAYIGERGFEDLVVDWRDKEIGNIYYQSRFFANEKNFCLALKRNIEIEDPLFNGRRGIYKGYSDEINLYRAIREDSFSITDPLFERLLEDNRKDGKIHNIIKSIQENQYGIITAPLFENILVNGCAGSGKTMILYHRLSYLLYNESDLKPNNVFVITPHALFNRFTGGLLGELRLDGITNLPYDLIWKRFIELYVERFGLYESVYAPYERIYYDIEKEGAYFHAVHEILDSATESYSRFVDWELQRLTHATGKEIARDCLSQISGKDLFDEKSFNFYVTAKGELAGFSAANMEYTLKEQQARYSNYGKYKRYFSKYLTKDAVYSEGGRLKKFARTTLFDDDEIEKFIRIADAVERLEALQQFLKGEPAWLYVDICQFAVENVNRSDNSDKQKKCISADVFIVRQLAERFGSIFKTKSCLFVDEVQNYSEFELYCLRILFGRGHINMFGDIRQRVENYGVSDVEQVDKIIRVKEYSLNENYRNAKEITDFVNDRLHLKMMAIGLHGKAEEIRSQEVKFEDGKENVVITKGRAEAEKFMALAPDTQGMRILDDETDRFATGVNILTVKQVKGLEFLRVYVYDCNMSDNEKYVAYTRALNELIVVKGGAENE